MAGPRIVLAGNPNCGKTTLFNALTGARQRVGNWAGVTVSRKTGRFSHKGVEVEVSDLPGVYSLSASDEGSEGGLDERIARDYLLAEKPDLVVDVIDATNLERNLYLTAQLIEMGAPLLVALTMTDAARAQGLAVDAGALSDRLGCPVLDLEGGASAALTRLRDALAGAEGAPRPLMQETAFEPALEAAVEDLARALPEAAHDMPAARWAAIKLIEGDGPRVSAETAAAAARTRARIEAELGMEADTAIACGRYALANRIASACLLAPEIAARPFSDRLDRLVLNRVLGIPIFLGVMYLMFMFTINFGGAFVDFFDILGATLFVETPRAILAAIGAPDWTAALLADGIGGGVQCVMTFIPIVGFLFLFLSALEDSGYMARAAFVMDRLMRAVGLPGKSFVPLIVGFGCNVPAIMAARTLDTRRDQIMTVLMAPFMSCSARLPVYAMFAAAFFPAGGQNLVFALYLVGILAAAGTGLLLRATLLPGQGAPFVMELPAWRLPRLRNLFLHAHARLKSFLLDAGKIIVIMVAILNFLSAWSPDGEFDPGHPDNSALAEVGRAVTPVFAPLGVREENWPAVVGLLSGALAKESVVGVLDALYSDLGGGDAAAPRSVPQILTEGLTEAFATIPPNLQAAVGMAGDPLGLDLGDVSTPEAAAAGQGVNAGVFSEMARLFDGQAGAFAYLLVVLLYLPCVAALGAIRREIGGDWAGFAAGWTLALAWGMGAAWYQAASFSAHPLSSGLWLAGLASALLAFAIGLRRVGRRRGFALATPARGPRMAPTAEAPKCCST